MADKVADINGINVEVRDAVLGDLNFIIASWLKSLYYGNTFYNNIDQDAYYANYEPIIKQYLAISSAKVACLAEDPDVILGYSIFKNATLHFIFVKKSYRKVGIGKLLVPQEITTVSHLTDLGNNLRKRLNFKYNPFSTGVTNE